MFKRGMAETVVAVGSLLTGEDAAAQNKSETKTPQKIEVQVKKREVAIDPQIKEVLSILEERGKNLANVPDLARDEKLKKSIEKEAYTEIIQIIINKLESFVLLDKPQLTTEEEDKLKTEAKKMGLTNDLIKKCRVILEEEKANPNLIQQERILSRIYSALAPSSRDMKSPPDIFKD